MEALELLKSNRFSLLFMDARMPGIDGLKATEFIRNDMNIKDVDMPVICISAAPVNEDWQKFQKAGMNAFLLKPFTEEALLTTILSVIKDYTLVSQTYDADPDNPESGSDNINLKNLYHISGGDEHFVKQMLISFIESTKNGLREMEEAVNSNNSDLVYELAHKMLPPGRHIGATGLCDSLKKIEENIKNKIDPESLRQLIQESVHEFNAVSYLIDMHIDKIN